MAANVLEGGHGAPRLVPSNLVDLPADLPMGMLTPDAVSVTASGGIADIAQATVDIPGALHVAAGILADIAEASHVAADTADASHVAADIADVANTAANAWAEGPSFHAEMSTHASHSRSSMYSPDLPLPPWLAAPHVSITSPSVATHPTSAPSASGPTLKCYGSISHPKPSGVIASCHAPPRLVPVHVPSPSNNTSQERNEDLAPLILNRLIGLSAKVTKIEMRLMEFEMKMMMNQKIMERTKSLPFAK